MAVDNDAIKEQMVAIIKANATLFDASGGVDKIRVATVGIPDGDSGFDNVFPQLYITNANPLERISLQGTMTGSSEALGCLLSTVRYKIIVAVNTQSSRDAENELDDFQKTVIETLAADSKFKNGGSAVVDSSRPELIETFKLNLNGQPIQGRTITYLVTKAT